MEYEEGKKKKFSKNVRYWFERIVIAVIGTLAGWFFRYYLHICNDPNPPSCSMVGTMGPFHIQIDSSTDLHYNHSYCDIYCNDTNNTHDTFGTNDTFYISSNIDIDEDFTRLTTNKNESLWGIEIFSNASLAIFTYQNWTEAHLGEPDDPHRIYCRAEEAGFPNWAKFLCIYRYPLQNGYFWFWPAGTGVTDFSSWYIWTKSEQRTHRILGIYYQQNMGFWYVRMRNHDHQAGS